ncbi:hypothetical protein [Sphingobium sp. TCM1]|uniref:hypothetical protein n=1 Tax=Sphingobium sp. TCM1 TaxID=453246 RepID=UPI0007F43871|nr:hypothetical protein [Sphingobium sp. TCM1]OAN56226.1 hypothetical protein A7Q26_02110 [Sphingobium sp. TCM1]
MKVHNKDGIEMMDIKSIDKDGDKLVIKGKMMGSMATVIHVKPEDLWDAFSMVSWKTLFSLPIMLLRGRSVKK